MNNSDSVDIPYDRFQAWMKSTEMLGELGSTLRHELDCFSKPPTRQQIERSARAARAAEARSTGLARLLACALALSLENAAYEMG